MHDKASLLALPLEDTVPPAVLEAGVGRTAAQEATARRARHVRDALRALGYGHGVHWAADITTLPLRFVVSVARAHGMTDAAGDEYDGWTGYSLAGLLGGPSRTPGRVAGRAARLPGRAAS